VYLTVFLQPYVPDFWDSTASKIQPTPVYSEELPKIVVVSGLDTYDGDGPTHNLEVVRENETVVVTTPGSTEGRQSKKSTQTGLLEDITEDLGIPRPKELNQSFWKFFS
jgi:hypothetical protein